MTFKQCAAFKQDGSRCQRVAKEGDYCHSHRLYINRNPPMPEPLPAGKIKLVSSTAWASCEFCHDAFPRVDLHPDEKGKVACDSCFFRSDIFTSSTPVPGTKIRFLAASRAEALARQNGLCWSEAEVELLENGFKPEKHYGHLIYIRTESAA